MAKFELFFKPQCPYCLKVLNYLHEAEIKDFDSYNIKDKNAGEENTKLLEKLGGKVQVPMMVVDGKTMYESDDIIEYCKEHFA